MPKLKSVYGGPIAKKAGTDVTAGLLSRIGEYGCTILAQESSKDFMKRGWSLNDPKGGPPLPDSFFFEIEGESTVVFKSSFWGLPDLSSRNIPPKKMPWLTQEAKLQHPERYKPTPTELRKGMTSPGNRMPLIVPLRGRSGEVILKTAPFSTASAWIHPGIAKFTFLARSLKKIRQHIVREVADGLADVLTDAVGKK